ncbi:PP2C family serine/threonine-protein phosphatase [Clostridium ihumii]|uniref:PP2C family serine/threonine-protein phosphatase n=1 Tax=Clostridium ihumii TaxID=1470356 RepID=UPI003D334F7B
MEENNSFYWLGSDDMSLNKDTIKNCGEIVIGYYGGNTESGADKNEDAAVLLCDKDSKWKFAMLLDAHGTSESAKLVVENIKKEQCSIEKILNLPIKNAFIQLHKLFFDMFNNEDFKEKCKNVNGETACLIVAQKEEYLWWMSIGDNRVYLLHPELMELNQFALNERQFYEWIGKVNTFDCDVPCYTTGTRLLREGKNYIYLITDGVLECGNRKFEDDRELCNMLVDNGDISGNISKVLNEVHKLKGRDSATMIGWSYFNNKKAPRPTR